MKAPAGGGLVLLQGDRPLHAPVLVDHHRGVGVLPGLGDALTDQFIAFSAVRNTPERSSIAPRVWAAHSTRLPAT